MIFPRKNCIHQLFERVVEQGSSSVAVSLNGSTLSYHELNSRANQLANYLCRFGIGPEKLVGIYLERSHNMIIGMLGILKAGGAYVPLDPEYPPERLAFMLQDARVSVILTQNSLLGRLPHTEAHIICMDRECNSIGGESNLNPCVPVVPENLAYIIYTSGSTGTPKGVMVTHYNVVRLFQATEQWFDFNRHDVWTFFHSHAFDFSVWEIWGALLYGGKLIIISYLTSRSPELFYKVLCTEKVTILNQTPSAFRQLIRAEEALVSPGDLYLRFVIFGGEALELQSLRPWFDRHGDQKPKLINMYGITETTVHVTYRPLSIDDMEKRQGSVIGVPIPDLHIHILDEALQPVPPGVPGEIYVGGAGVARGYLYRDALTAERFIKNPFSNDLGDTIYKTGDMAKYLPDRDIEYLGRIDAQVKIRGFRVELGEIESALCHHPHVRETVVIAHTDQNGHKGLAAYVVLKQGSKTSIHDMKNFLKVKLPEYMLPASFVFLEKFPMTPHGKIDRAALPKPRFSRENLATAYVPPGTIMEQKIVSIFKEILRIPEIGIHDNFFDLGGDSLLAAQVIMQIRDVCKCSIEIVKLFEHPTVHALAGYLGMSAPAENIHPSIFNRAEKKKSTLLKRRQQNRG